MEVMNPTYLELIKPYYYEGHQPARIVTVVVSVGNDGVKIEPHDVRVENENQTVIWIALDGEIDTIVFHENEKTPGPPAISGRGRRHEARFPADLHTGPHKYDFTFHTDDGRTITVDPIAVIEY